LPRKWKRRSWGSSRKRNSCRPLLAPRFLLPCRP
jgi:hypothetical protein